VETDGVLRHLNPLGDSPRRSLADSCAHVLKVWPTAELEDVLAGLFIAVLPEPFGSAAVGNHVCRGAARTHRGGARWWR